MDNKQISLTDVPPTVEQEQADEEKTSPLASTASAPKQEHTQHFRSLKTKQLMSLIVLFFVFVCGGVVGFVIGHSLLSGDQNDANPLLSMQSKAIVQRSMVAKGIITEIHDSSLTIVPTQATASEAESDKLVVDVQPETAIYLQLIDAKTNKSDTPQKVELTDLQKDDQIDIYSTVSDDGALKVTSATARRTK